MKIHPLIIDLRRQIPWHKRYLSMTLTAMLWTIWLLLWRPVIMLLGFISVQNPKLLHHFLDVFTQVVENGFTALVACAISLWLWGNFMSSKAVKHKQQTPLDDYANFFVIDSQKLEQSRHQKIVTVHHNEHGKIIALD